MAPTPTPSAPTMKDAVAKLADLMASSFCEAPCAVHRSLGQDRSASSLSERAWSAKYVPTPAAATPTPSAIHAGARLPEPLPSSGAGAAGAASTVAVMARVATARPGAAAGSAATLVAGAGSSTGIVTDFASPLAATTTDSFHGSFPGADA